MSSELKLRRGSTAAHSTFTGADGEVTLDTDKNVVVSHDGITLGGFPHTKAVDLAASSGASLVGFQQAGAGAVARTGQDKMRDVVSVKDFSAVGDGVTNDTDAFVAASARITSLGGGKLVVPAGTYKVGKQIFAGATGKGYAYLGVDIITIQNCTSPVVVEFQGVTLMYETGLKFGSFDPVTGAVYTPASLPFTNYDYQASIGCAMRLQYNTEVAVVGNVVINGRNDTAVLGGQWGDAGYQCVAYGLYLYQNNRTYVQNVYVKYMHTDGVALRFPSLVEGGPGTPALLENITSVYNGRQGFSWTGGIGLTVINMITNYNGRSTFFSAPASGIDIEAEDGIVRKGRFINCESIDNRGNALVADSGNSADVEFENCLFIGTGTYPLWPKKPNFTFRNCKIYGSVVNTIASVDPRVRTKFYDCYFSDEIINDLTPYVAGGHLFGTVQSAPVLFSRCSVKTTRSAIGRLDKAILDGCYFNMQAGTGYIANQGAQAHLNGAVLKDNTFESNITVDPPVDGHIIQMTQTERCYGDNNLINTAGIVRWHNWSTGGGGVIGLLGGLGRNGDLPQSQYRLSLNNNQFPWSYYGTSDFYAGIEAPTSGTFKRGDRVFNNNPAVGSPKSWVCTVAGEPGTWVSEGNL
jgi:hypothetical protein